MTDILIRISGRAGRITLNRPDALNALTYQMCLAIDDALKNWANDPAVQLVVIDAAGDKAFCAGGDIADMYKTGSAGNFVYGRTFWRDEYRLNARIATYPKPYVALMQGFTMGGGVGISCHGSHRIVCEGSQIAMPEAGIGLVPDVGGSLLLGRAPGFVGEYLGSTGARMTAGDAIFAGFADSYVPRDRWGALVADLERTGSPDAIKTVAEEAPQDSPLAAQQPAIDRHFSCATLAEIDASLTRDDSAFAQSARKRLAGVSPLAASAAIELIRRARKADDITQALTLEYQYTYRAAAQGDFIEGIRAAIIDKDRSPNWAHRSFADVSQSEVDTMLAPLGPHALDLTEDDR